MNVDRLNFNELFPLISNDIRECDFIAFDLEYSGIKLQHQKDYTLFDSMADRYKHINDAVQSFTPFQLGIVLFKRELNDSSILNYSSKFRAKLYNLSLYPLGSDIFDSSFICSAAALRFLRKHGMDLNDIVDNGITFLNKEEFNQLKNKLDVTTIISGLSEDQKYFLEGQRKEVSSFLLDNKTIGQTIEFDMMYGLHSYFQQVYLRSHFVEITTKVKNNKVIVERIDPSQKYNIEQIEEDFDAKSEKYKFCVEMLGVSKIWKLISRLKKPIVGHNCLFDVVSIYQKFFDNLPPLFDDFKYDLLQVLPTIFDTKFIFGRMRMSFKELGEIEGGLGTIYNGLSKMNENCKGFDIKIELESNQNEGENVTNQKFQAHEAGYDAFMTGCCLLYLANMLFRGQISEDVESKPTSVGDVRHYDIANRRSTKVTLPSFETYEEFLKPWKNAINVIRAHNFCVYLDENRKDDGYRTACGRKLLTRRPNWLVVYDSNPTEKLVPLDHDKILETVNETSGDNEDDNEENGNHSCSEEAIFCQAFLEQLLFEFGDGDIRKLNPATDERYQKYIVATTSYNVMRAFIRRSKKRYPRLVIRDYNIWSDNVEYKRGLLTATAISSVFGVWSLIGLIKEIRQLI